MASSYMKPGVYIEEKNVFKLALIHPAEFIVITFKQQQQKS
jgi:hypothetical protein